jgi:hypothetical protein
MTNQEKSKELGIKYERLYARQYYHNVYPEYSNDSGFVYSNKEIEMACQEMAEWKEKCMMADIRAWLREICRVCDITDENGYSIDEHSLFASFEKTLKR